MKKISFIFALLSCLSGATSATVFTGVEDATGRVASDGKNTIVAITRGTPKTPTHPTYALHYSKDFGKTWQPVVNGDDSCVKWHVDSQKNIDSSFNSIRYLTNGRFYAVGSDRRVCSSANGIDGWVADTGWDGGYATDTLADIAIGTMSDGTVMWVVVGNNGAIYSRTVNSQWIANFQQNSAVDYAHVKSNNRSDEPTFVAYAGTHLWYSHNAHDWAKVNTDQFKNVNFFLGFSNLYYEPNQKKFTILILSESGSQLIPLVLASENGESWQLGKGFSEDAHSFEDITYASDQKAFYTIGVHAKNAETGKGDTNTSPDAVTWTDIDRSGPLMYSLVYSEKTQRLIATSVKPLDNQVAPPIFDGIVTKTLEGQWTQANLVNTGKCATTDKPVGLLSKPIVVKDQTGKEHFIATPQYPDGCAYWSNSDDPNTWTASDYLWN